MILRWLICFSLATLPLVAATVSGRVELRDSRDPAVRNRKDYSGVVIALKPLDVTPPPAGDKHAVMLQKDKTFSPHVLAVEAGSVVDFPNADPIFHNAFSSYSGQVFDIGLYPPGTTRSLRFAREGVVRVFCNIHASMSAVIVVLGSPYFATTKRDGAFELSGVPPGDYQLTVFHERASEDTLEGLKRKVTVGPDGASLEGLMISEGGYLSIPHKNKYGHEYPPDSGDQAIYPGKK
ncbi:MAG TPA: carboxypeptidase regulatory-like domain-containing protein [Bryobacteraceae bacterium]|nr:carboxypeptidase regulatory-like domain-containing protein [Bryobacteraceae bacterium]